MGHITKHPVDVEANSANTGRKKHRKSQAVRAQRCRTVHVCVNIYLRNKFLKKRAKELENIKASCVYDHRFTY